MVRVHPDRPVRRPGQAEIEWSWSWTDKHHTMVRKREEKREGAEGTNGKPNIEWSETERESKARYRKHEPWQSNRKIKIFKRNLDKMSKKRTDLRGQNWEINLVFPKKWVKLQFHRKVERKKDDKCFFAAKEICLRNSAIQENKLNKISKEVQANKSIGRMPWHQEPMKDVTSCDKLRGAANKLRSADFRMWKHTERYH